MSVLTGRRHTHPPPNPPLVRKYEEVYEQLRIIYLFL